MTTLSDAQVLGELGWTMQIIHDLSGGYVPRFWRPPYVILLEVLRSIPR